MKTPSNHNGIQWKMIIGGALVWTALVVLVTSHANRRELDDPNLSRQTLLMSSVGGSDAMARMDIVESAMEMNSKPSAAVMRVMAEVVPEGDSGYGYTRSWHQIPGLLKHVSMSRNGVIWGVNRHDDIFQNRWWGGKSWGWRHIPGKLMQISVGGDNGEDVIGVNKHHDIFQRDGIGRSAVSGTRWAQIPGKLMDISMDNIRTFGVNGAHHIYERTNDMTWHRIPGLLVQINVGGAHVVGVNKHQGIFSRIGGAWRHIPGLATVAAQAADGELWVVNRHDDIFRWCGGGCGSRLWQQIPGKLRQIHVASRTQIIGVNGNNDIFVRR